MEDFINGVVSYVFLIIEKLLNEDCWIMHLGERMAFEILWMDLLHILLKTELRMHLGKG